MNEETCRQFIEAIADAAAAINDAQQEEGERGRGDDVLVLAIAEDGSGIFGRVWHDIALDSNVIEEWFTAHDAAEFAKVIMPYLEGEKEHARGPAVSIE